MRVVLVGRFQDLHAVDADPSPHRVLGAPQAKFGHAVQQHVVELASKRSKKIISFRCARISALAVEALGFR